VPCTRSRMMSAVRAQARRCPGHAKRAASRRSRAVNLRDALIVALLATGCVRVMMPPAVTAPLWQPLPASPDEPPAAAWTDDMVWQYAANSINPQRPPHERHSGPVPVHNTSIGQLPWTKAGAVQDIGGTSDVLLTGQRPDASGCVGWVILLVHAPSGSPQGRYGLVWRRPGRGEAGTEPTTVWST